MRRLEHQVLVHILAGEALIQLETFLLAQFDNVHTASDLYLRIADQVPRENYLEQDLYQSFVKANSSTLDTLKQLITIIDQDVRRYLIETLESLDNFNSSLIKAYEKAIPEKKKKKREIRTHDKPNLSELKAIGLLIASRLRAMNNHQFAIPECFESWKELVEQTYKTVKDAHEKHKKVCDLLISLEEVDSKKRNRILQIVAQFGGALSSPAIGAA